MDEQKERKGWWCDQCDDGDVGWNGLCDGGKGRWTRQLPPLCLFVCVCVSVCPRGDQGRGPADTTASTRAPASPSHHQLHVHLHLHVHLQHHHHLPSTICMSIYHLLLHVHLPSTIYHLPSAICTVSGVDACKIARITAIRTSLRGAPVGSKRAPSPRVVRFPLSSFCSWTNDHANGVRWRRRAA